MGRPPASLALLLFAALPARPWSSSGGGGDDSEAACRPGCGPPTAVDSAAAVEPRALSDGPRIYLLEGFLSGSDTEHLHKVATELGVFREATPDPQDSQDNHGYHQEYVEEERYAWDTRLAAIEARIVAHGHVPPDPGSAATISLSVRNASGPGMTNLHHDHNAAALALAPYAKQGHRVPLTELQSTLLGYFTDVQSGGETVFPCVCDRSNDKCRKAQQACKYLYENGVFNVHPAGYNAPFREASAPVRKKLKKAADLLVDRTTRLCSLEEAGTGASHLGLRVEARAGRAVLFFSNNVRGRADPRAWHGSCRVVVGQKLTIQRFLYAPQADSETGAHASATFSW